MFRRRQFLAHLGLGVAALVPLCSVRASGGSAFARSEIAPSGAMIHGEWAPDAKIWFDIQGERMRVVRIDERGIWFVPSEDSPLMALQPYTQKAQGKERGLICYGNVYCLNGDKPLAMA